MKTTKISSPGGVLNDLRSYSRQWLEDFIETYRKEECLWRGKHQDYSNHFARNNSYDKLVEKLKEVEPNPDRAMVVKKINSLRSAFRREFRKTISKENYVSRLWYFEKLMFISDQSPKRMCGAPPKRELKLNFIEDSIELATEEESEQQKEQVLNESTGLMDEVQNDENNHIIKGEHNNNSELQQPQSDIKVLEITSLDANSQREIQQAVNSLEQHQQQMQQHMQSNQQTQQTHLTPNYPTIQISREHLPTLFNSTAYETPQRTNDEFDAVGVNIASKLRIMNHTQRIIAEKLISDILFNGQLDNLNISSTLLSGC